MSDTASEHHVIYRSGAVDACDCPRPGDHAANAAALFTHVAPELILEQREQGWPDMHPEDFCHRCGDRNMHWSADPEDWEVATKSWAEATGMEGICCPRCFAEMHLLATGKRIIWTLAAYRLDDGEIYEYGNGAV